MTTPPDPDRAALRALLAKNAPMVPGDSGEVRVIVDTSGGYAPASVRAALRSLRGRVEELEDQLCDWRQACVANCHDYDPSICTPATVDGFRERIAELEAALRRVRPCVACTMMSRELLPVIDAVLEKP